MSDDRADDVNAARAALHVMQMASRRQVRALGGDLRGQVGVVHEVGFSREDGFVLLVSVCADYYYRRGKVVVPGAKSRLVRAARALNTEIRSVHRAYQISLRDGSDFGIKS